MEGWLWKCTRNAKRRNILTRTRERRRWFVLAEGGASHPTLRYFHGDEMTGRPSRSFILKDSRVLVKESDGAFTVETSDWLLSLRADYASERSLWVCALMRAGARPHPSTRFLAAHLSNNWRESEHLEELSVTRSCGNSSEPSCSGSGRGDDFAASHLNIIRLPPVAPHHACPGRVFVDVPEGLMPGDQFHVTVPSGQQLLVRVPSGAIGGTLEVYLRSRLPAPSAQAARVCV